MTCLSCEKSSLVPLLHFDLYSGLNSMADIGGGVDFKEVDNYGEFLTLFCVVFSGFWQFDSDKVITTSRLSLPSQVQSTELASRSQYQLIATESPETRENDAIKSRKLSIVVDSFEICCLLLINRTRTCGSFSYLQS